MEKCFTENMDVSYTKRKSVNLADRQAVMNALKKLYGSDDITEIVHAKENEKESSCQKESMLTKKP